MKKILLISILFSFASIADDTVYVYGTLIPKKAYDDSGNSLSMRSGQDIDNARSFQIEDLIKTIPNINYSQGSSNTRYFQIRGIGERASYEGMPNHSVGIVIDDIDYSGIAGVSSLRDISQVEVYRGPQATRLGPSALAGMIHMSSLEPSKKFKGQAFFNYGNYRLIEEGVGASFPVSQNFQGALSLSKKDSDGYMNNNFLNRKDTNGKDEFTTKAKLLGRINGFKLKLNLHYFNLNNGYDAFTQSNNRITTSDKPGQDDQRTLAQALRVEKILGGDWKSISIFTHIKSKIFYSYDEDWGNNIQWNALPGYNANYDYNIEFPKIKEDLSIDQRLVKAQKLVLGLYGKLSHESFGEVAYKNEAVRKNIRGNFKTKELSLYFENESDLSDNISLDYGARIASRSAIYNDSLGNNFSPDEFMYGGKISLNYHINKESKLYGKLSKGFKAGGFNTQSDVPMDRKEFKQEKLYSLEIGNQNNFKHLNLSTNLSTFFMYREDIQVKTSFQDDPSDPSSYTFYNDNATDGYNYGLELEGRWNGVEGLELLSSLGLLKTEYGNYSYASKSLKDRDMPHAPEYQFNLSSTYRLDNGFYFGGNVFMSDNFYFSNSHSEKSRAYQLVDIKAGYKIKRFSISIWSKNIFNEDYSTRGFFFANRPPDWNDERYTQRGVPRTYGVSLRYTF
ncbi:TonB-dependent receptor [Bacteriovorax sp. Seq25_V]|uniref:TonB-dependent receptor n=1 Tax=Bacteriovorax sp. Seq25_V TaxID=1201288 RepID=UPI000389F308|nr:TonB-dependent receptor [Bacteriovorax sp. Seq25_V]EQC43889.1 TonB-dependent receptor [Bacteriovorax sp. Seq25_V]